ncbi:MAG TPA: SRPBCC domain-containing protein [Rhizomicrobium sp.]|jgi:hypothetical protein
MTATIHAERAVTLARVLKAPRALVWQAWTDAKMLKQWWGGRHHRGLEVTSRLQRLNEPPSPEIWSRAYMFNSGLTLDYVYEMTGPDLTIWFGHKGSDNHMRGRVSSDGQHMEAAWQWPGGGYRITAEHLG